AEVELFGELTDRLEDFLVAEMRIADGADLNACICNKARSRVVEQPAVLFGLIVEICARIGGSQRNLQRMRVHLLGEADRLPNCLLGFARQTEHEGPVHLDSELVTVRREAAQPFDSNALLDIVQYLLVA